MNKKIFRLMSIFMTFVLMLGNSYSVSAAYDEHLSQSQAVAALPALPRMEGFGVNILGRQGRTANEITITNDLSSVSQVSHAEVAMPMADTALTERPILINALTRPMKYYGVDRGSPYTDANYATLAQHAVKTIIVDTFINDANNSSSAKWSHIKALAAQYNFNYVIWPNQGSDVPGCGWETPFNSPQNGDYIWRVTTMLDSFTTDPHFIGMISAHEPMWNTSTCKTSISDMASIKTQLKNYMRTKGRTDFKVWNYIDNVSDLKNMPGFVSADIERVMDVAVTWQHCFGGAEGTCSGAKNKIIADRALIDNAGLNGKVDLVYLFQTFATGGGYSMPTLTDMQTWDCQFIATNALDGFIYYTWGAWYSTDLSNHPELWPEMNRVYDSCINQAPDTSTPTVLSSVRANVNPTSAISVGFTVTFSESVTGVTADDFSLTTSGVSGAAVSGISGSGNVYTVSVNTGSGNGTIRLDVVDNNSIVDSASNPLGGTAAGDGNFSAGDIYSINKSGGGDTTGVFRPSNGLLYLKNVNAAGFADVAINYGTAGDYPVTGDWDGNGSGTIGIYRNGIFYLQNSNTPGFANLVFTFGQPGDQPVAGDWNGDGVDTIGVYRNGLFLLRNSNFAGASDTSFALGNPGDIGIVGDWNGDGMDTTGVFRPSNGIIFLKNANTTGFADIALNYGLTGDRPVTGDWNNDGIDTIGVYRNAQFLLRNSNTIGFADIVFALGNPGDMPIAGNWDGIP